MKAFRIKWISGEREIIVAENIFQAGGFYISTIDCGIDAMENAEIEEIDFNKEPKIEYWDFEELKEINVNNINDFKKPQYLCGSMY